jgi:hypothetical protein
MLLTWLLACAAITYAPLRAASSPTPLPEASP